MNALGPKGKYPYLVITTYVRRKPIDTPHLDIGSAISTIRAAVDYRKISGLLTIKLMKGDRTIWRKSFGT